MTNEQDIIDKVHAAFKDVPLPSAEALWNNHCCECSETSAAFGARPWSEISLDDLLSGRETALLSEVAWRYYLPSMIIWCIRAPKDVDVIQDNLVYQLAPPETQEQWAWEWSNREQVVSIGNNGKQSWHSSSGTKSERKNTGLDSELHPQIML
jgi:hypothetical protein